MEVVSYIKSQLHKKFCITPDIFEYNNMDIVLWSNPNPRYRIIVHNFYNVVEFTFIDTFIGSRIVYDAYTLYEQYNVADTILMHVQPNFLR